MTINDLLEQGITIQGNRIVTAIADGGSGEITLDDDGDEWGWSSLDDEWADWEINYIHPDRHGNVVFELDNPNS